ncbi:hypothetical protein JAAARDRAFT_29088 [Jaapia argillacea MUCL 33604]|uniref:Uncharacterized protein n=1 Tax=Jaapia argillacea MUCL 33604 TaxID=933084 RepID=A0A067QKD7_9AGAM|nr:hypothetical protein JAAARDRAFT_29088 [Jaapia argillacea MUCL 33604]
MMDESGRSGLTPFASCLNQRRSKAGRDRTRDKSSPITCEYSIYPPIISPLSSERRRGMTDGSGGQGVDAHPGDDHGVETKQVE